MSDSTSIEIQEDQYHVNLEDDEHFFRVNAQPSPLRAIPPSPVPPIKANVDDPAWTNPRFTNEDLVLCAPYHDSSLTSISHELFLGKIFRSKEELKTSVAVFAMKNHFEFRVQRSNPDNWYLKCAAENCSWKLRGRSMLESPPFFKISVLLDEHTCGLELRRTRNRQAAPRVVGHLMKNKFTTTCSKYTARNLQEDMKTQFGIDMSYQTAWKCKEKALGLAMGTPEESYSKLPRFLYMLQLKNPGTVTDFQCENGRFKYCFFAIGSCLHGFRHIRPVLCVDGTFIKSKYRGQLLTAVGLDGDGGLFPIAFAIVDSENNASWLYFMSKLKEAIGSVDDLVFVSDRHQSIANALENIFPEAHHGACYNHVKMNIQAKFNNDDSILYVYNAAYAFRPSEFFEAFNMIRALYPRVADYLEEIGFERWARCYFPGKRYNIMTSNYAESFNKVVAVARTFPITNMVEFIRFTLGEWFYDRRTKAGKNHSMLSPLMEDDLRKNCDMAQRLTVHCLSHDEFQVMDQEGSCEVNLSTRDCTCGVFQHIGIPCVHAAAACLKRSINVYTLCSPFYSVDSLRRAYEGVIYPTGDECDWMLPDDLRNIKVRVPAEKRSVGRPKKDKGGRPKIKRRPSQGEHVVVHKKCGRCGGLGHNRVTCNFRR